MLCGECDNEATPENPPVWSEALDMYVCMFCSMGNDDEEEEDV